jgi:hypothetical protein
MKKKTERRGRIWFSEARFRRLPMAEKLSYLRTAFAALGKGLRVLERRRVARDAPRPGSPRPPSAPVRLVRLLSQANFDRLAMEDKLSYLSRAIREVNQLGEVTPVDRRMRGRVPTS